MHISIYALVTVWTEDFRGDFYETNPRFHDPLQAFEALTGCSVLINTSFNVRGEPIVCTPQDAHRCFMRTEMDYLVLGPFLIAKEDQPNRIENASGQAFALD